jgi:KaiC/GvpD/RAD55 family RecA-like ATPase
MAERYQKIAVKQRIKTYIDGFDDLLGGGIPEGYIVILAGTTGTMKSSLAYSILHNNALNGKKCVFISLEQTAESLWYHMRSLGLDPDDVKANLTILDLPSLESLVGKKTPEKSEDEERMKTLLAAFTGDVGLLLDEVRGKNIIEVLKKCISLFKTKSDISLLALDSLAILELATQFKNIRAEFFNFFEWLRKLNITTFITAEMSEDSNMYCRYGESYIADGLIHLLFKRIGDVNVQRRIRCVKMRGTKHHIGYLALMFSDGKFEVTEAISA